MNATIIDLENSIWDIFYNTQKQIMSKTTLLVPHEILTLVVLVLLTITSKSAEGRVL